VHAGIEVHQTAAKSGLCVLDPVREAVARTDNAPSHWDRHLPLRCARALRCVRRWAAHRGRRRLRDRLRQPKDLSSSQKDRPV